MRLGIPSPLYPAPFVAGIVSRACRVCKGSAEPLTDSPHRSYTTRHTPSPWVWVITIIQHGTKDTRKLCSLFPNTSARQRRVYVQYRSSSIEKRQEGSTQERKCPRMPVSTLTVLVQPASRSMLRPQDRKSTRL